MVCTYFVGEMEIFSGESFIRKWMFPQKLLRIRMLVKGTRAYSQT